MHEGHAGSTVAVLNLYPLSIYGDVHKSHACACKQTARAQLNRSLCEAAQRDGDEKDERSTCQNNTASPASDEIAAAEQRCKTGQTETEQHQTEL